MTKKLRRSFFAIESHELAPLLLNKVLVRGDSAGTSVSGRIVEVEAYAGEDDPASHAFRGRTERTEVMFGPPGHLYVYFTYGMHFCANVVCGSEGRASAVLIRALAPMEGLDTMRARRRGLQKSSDLASGPAKLCQALAINNAHNGADLVTGDAGFTLVDDGVVPPARPGRSGRVGVSTAADVPWRWWVPADPHVSRGKAVPHHLIG